MDRKKPKSVLKSPIGQLFVYLVIILACILSGALVLGGAGFVLGMLLAHGYTKRGPSDPGDAPVYVGIGLVFFGALIGATIGIVCGIAMCIIRARRKGTPPSYL